MKTARFYLKVALATSLALVIVIYSGFELRGLIQGPRIFIEKPLDGATITQPVITVSGKASLILFLYLNGRQIYTDENGFFEEPIVLGKGYNIITVEGHGRFNKTITHSIRVIVPESN